MVDDGPLIMQVFRNRGALEIKAMKTYSKKRKKKDEIPM